MTGIRFQLLVLVTGEVNYLCLAHASYFVNHYTHASWLGALTFKNRASYI